MFPTDVVIDEATLRKLTKTLKKAYKQIVSELINATDFGVYNRQVILAQIDRHLEALGVDVQKFIEAELPKYYKMGADDAIAQLRLANAPLEFYYGFNSVHIEAIQALIADTAKAFGESLTGISRSANNILGKITRELITQKLAEGMIGGATLKEVRNIIKGIIADQGLSALVDKSGRAWTLDRYTEMLIRTKSVEARNRGLINRVVENKYDLVQVSSHWTSCELCQPWEGKVLSLTGATGGYPTLAQAESEGLFHPNCRHAINTIKLDLSQYTYEYNPDTGTYAPPKVAIKDID